MKTSKLGIHLISLVTKERDPQVMVAFTQVSEVFLSEKHEVLTHKESLEYNRTYCFHLISFNQAMNF